MVDILRLEVALVDGRELFAWPGAKKFEEADVSKMISSGALGNGNFGTYAKALFTTTGPDVSLCRRGTLPGEKGPSTSNSRSRRCFPDGTFASRTRVQPWAITGSFYADPVTFDLEHIEVIADDIPSMLMLSSVVDKVDYAAARIGDGNFLLPSESEISSWSA